MIIPTIHNDTICYHLLSVFVKVTWSILAFLLSYSTIDPRHFRSDLLLCSFLVHQPHRPGAPGAPGARCHARVRGCHGDQKTEGALGHHEATEPGLSVQLLELLAAMAAMAAMDQSGPGTIPLIYLHVWRCIRLYNIIQPPWSSNMIKLCECPWMPNQESLMTIKPISKPDQILSSHRSRQDRGQKASQDDQVNLKFGNSIMHRCLAR